MEHDNAVDIQQSPLTRAANAPSVSPRDQIARQITATTGNGDGGIFSQLASNPFFTAGFGLAALGFAATWGQKGLRSGAALLRRRLLVDVEITSRDNSYQWFLRWMTAHQRSRLITSLQPTDKTLVSKLARKFMPGARHLSIQTSVANLPGGLSQTAFALVPGPGRHFLFYKNAFIAVNRQRDSKMFDSRSSEPFETVTLTTLYSHRHIFETLFGEAHDLAQHEQEGKTTIYTSRMTEWQQFGHPKRKRPLVSVVLETGLKERIVADVKDFLGARNWYLDRGIPYRRGYLLYGPPGTGKSSFIEALAGELDFNIAMLHLSQRGLTDDLLYHLLSVVPPRTIVLLEDADAAFNNRRQSDEHGYRGGTVTFSGLLNALDGVVSAEERIIFLTTNHVERMDEALVRPGRVDMIIRLGEATEAQIEQMWDRFYSDQDLDRALVGAFLAKCRKLGLLGHVSTAALQGLFLFNKDNPQGAIESAEALSPKQHVRSMEAGIEKAVN